MNALSIERQVRVIAALTEGCSIRATERLTDTHRDTVMRLGVQVGEGCRRIHDALMRDLQVNLIEMDEQWAFIGKKQKRVKTTDAPELGDVWLFVALDATSKAVLSYTVGKRTGERTEAFALDLRARVLNRPQITADGFHVYPGAVSLAFGNDCDFAQLQKIYQTTPGNEAAVRYSPGSIRSVDKRIVCGEPDEEKISTSYIERFNLTTRMQMRRYTRLTSGFSRKLENHSAAVSLHMAHYNFCRIHEALRCTPAMALGVANHVWTIRELVDAALNMPEPPPVLPDPSTQPVGTSAARGKGERRGSGPSRWHRGGLRVIKGGRQQG